MRRSLVMQAMWGLFLAASLACGVKGSPRPPSPAPPPQVAPSDPERSTTPENPRGPFTPSNAPDAGSTP